jgi:hypothetical protein
MRPDTVIRNVGHMEHTHSLVVRMPPALVVDGIARGIDLGDDRIAIDGAPSAVPWVGDLEAVRHDGTWQHGRRAHRVTLDTTPLSDRTALVSLTAVGRGVDLQTVVGLIERVRTRLIAGVPSPSARTVPTSVLRPIAVATP